MRMPGFAAEAPLSETGAQYRSISFAVRASGAPHRSAAAAFVYRICSIVPRTSTAGAVLLSASGFGIPCFVRSCMTSLQ
jgi:hypothetical protein